MSELNVERGLILTQDEEPSDPAFLEIKVAAIYQWLLIT